MVSCLCPSRRLVQAVLLRVSPAVLVFAVAAARLADYQVSQVALADVAPAAFLPDLVLYEPVALAVAAVARLADYQVAQVADTVALVVAVAVALAPLLVHRAAAVVLVAPDAQLALHEQDAQCAAAAVAVAQQHDLSVVPQAEVVPRLSAVPWLAAVPLFVLPAAEVRRCLDPGPDAHLAPGTSAP